MPTYEERVAEIVIKATTHAHDAAKTAADKIPELEMPNGYKSRYSQIFGHVFGDITKYMMKAYGITFDNTGGEP